MSKTAAARERKALTEEVGLAIAKIEKLKEKRSRINTQIAEIIEGLEVQGISRHAVRAAMRYAQMDEKRRTGFDIAYAISRESLGHGLQSDLFDGVPPAPEPDETDNDEDQAALH